MIIPEVQRNPLTRFDSPVSPHREHDVVEGCWRLKERPLQTLSILQSFMEDQYPSRRVPDFSNPNDTTYEAYSAGVVHDKKQGDSPVDVVFIYLAGMTGTAPGQLHFGEEIVRAYRKQGKNAVFVGINSSFCMDTTQGTIPQIESRAAHMAALSYEIAKQYEDAEVFIGGHSMGGMEAVYTAPMVDHLLKTNDKKLSGLLLTQVGGLFDQNIPSFMRRNMEEQQLRTATDLVYPTLENIEGYQTLLDSAQAGNYIEEVARLQTYISHMFERIRHNVYLGDLTTIEKVQYTRIMTQLEAARAYGAHETVKDLIEQRYQLLKHPTLRRLQGYDRRQGGFVKGLKSFIRFAKTGAMIPFTLPQYVRSTVTSPVVMMWGDRDLNFPTDLAHQSIEQWQKKHKQPLFSQAGRVYDATVLGWPHGGFVDVTSFAEYCTDLTDKILQGLSSDTIRYGYPPQEQQ